MHLPEQTPGKTCFMSLIDDVSGQNGRSSVEKKRSHCVCKAVHSILYRRNDGGWANGRMNDKFGFTEFTIHYNNWAFRAAWPQSILKLFEEVFIPPFCSHFVLYGDNGSIYIPGNCLSNFLSARYFQTVENGLDNAGKWFRPITEEDIRTWKWNWLYAPSKLASVEGSNDSIESWTSYYKDVCVVYILLFVTWVSVVFL